MTNHEIHRHRAQRVVGMVIKILIFLIVAIAGFGSAVYQLWNWLMPGLFHLPVISFWQAVGLLGLSWLLFGGWRGFGWRDHRRQWRHRLMERWTEMTPEEREKFRESLGRC